MIFEKQDYQEQCVSNIISILDRMDNFDDNDFSDLQTALSEHYEEQGYRKEHFPITNRQGIDILMETGTGKTFCYLQTIFEINKRFGKNRFVIMVPRRAIRAGVKQNIEDTKQYFKTEYEKEISVIELSDTGKGDPTDTIVNNFIKDDNRIQVLLLTNSAINKTGNKMNKMPQQGSLFRNGTVWENVAKKSPVVIIDEPHMLTGSATTEALAKLNHSLVLRFGATYPNDSKDTTYNLSNVAYVLDSISAFNQFLVKRIRVNTILTQDTAENYQLSCIESREKRFTLSYFINNEHHSRTVQKDTDIGAKTGIQSLNGVKASKVNATKVYLSDSRTLELDTGFSVSDEESRIMIRQTIEKHFEKEQNLFKNGIKTLSLFFIPTVDGFRGEDPTIKRIFEEEYKNIRARIYQSTSSDYKKYLDGDYNTDKQLFVHQGYFSGDKGSSEEDKAMQGVREILHDKNSLLSLNGKMSNLRFIFSVWALQEGWDNPNVMNICKLTSTKKDTSRRQQVGRGLRIAVNQQGQRQTHKHLNDDDRGTNFYDINTLDMVVSHHEIDFIDNIQREIQSSSFGMVGDIITAEKLTAMGIKSTSAMEFILKMVEKDIAHELESREIEIKSSIIEFMRGHRESLSFLSENECKILEKTFGNCNNPAVVNGNQSAKSVKIRSDKLNQFKELWEAINRKSKVVYQNLNAQSIVDKVAQKFNEQSITPVKIRVVEQEYDSQNDQIKTNSEKHIATEINYRKHFSHTDFIHDIVGKTNLPLPYVINILNAVDMNVVMQNPKQAKSRLINIIQDTIHETVINCVDYNFNSAISITKTALHDDDGEYFEQINYTKLGRYVSEKPPMDTLLYDTVVYDSQIEEHAQTAAPQKPNGETITVFAKLPKISIPTPYKTYNPDFAYLIETDGKKKMFLVVETKGYNTTEEIDAWEQKKIDYGKKFFESLQNELPDIDIHFKTRINTNDLTQILTDIRAGK